MYKKSDFTDDEGRSYGHIYQMAQCISYQVYNKFNNKVPNFHLKKKNTNMSVCDVVLITGTCKL